MMLRIFPLKEVRMQMCKHSPEIDVENFPGISLILFWNLWILNFKFKHFRQATKTRLALVWKNYEIFFVKCFGTCFINFRTCGKISGNCRKYSIYEWFGFGNLPVLRCVWQQGEAFDLNLPACWNISEIMDPCKYPGKVIECSFLAQRISHCMPWQSRCRWFFSLQKKWISPLAYIFSSFQSQRGKVAVKDKGRYSLREVPRPAPECLGANEGDFMHMFAGKQAVLWFLVCT